MDKSIQINRLLIEREDHFAEIFDLERQVNIVLGKNYPFTQESILPSQQRRKKKKRKAVEKKAPKLRLRKLNPETETAYRITYVKNDQAIREIHQDPRPLIILLNTALPHLTILTVETVYGTEENSWQTVEVLFKA